MDPDGLLHQAGLEDVHDQHPADTHEDRRRQDEVRPDEDRDDHGRRPAQERTEERDRHQAAGDHCCHREIGQAEQGAGDRGDRRVDDPEDRLASQEAAE